MGNRRALFDGLARLASGDERASQRRAYFFLEFLYFLRSERVTSPAATRAPMQGFDRREPTERMHLRTAGVPTGCMLQ